MLRAIVSTFAAVFLLLCLQICAHWFLARRQQRRRRAHIVFATDLSSSTADTLSRGLEPTLLESLPTFVYSSGTYTEVLECAVCLSEFGENEKGRILPECKHSFHTDCIDMWFHSHSTCPLCRSLVTKTELFPQQAETVTDITSNSSLDTSSASSSSGNQSVGSRKKAFDVLKVSIEVPRRTDEVIQGSPAVVFKSPGGRLLSFRMRFCRDKRHSSASISCDSAMEFDLESGEPDEDYVDLSSEQHC